MKKVKILLQGEYIGITKMTPLEIYKAEKAGFTVIIK